MIAPAMNANNTEPRGMARPPATRRAILMGAWTPRAVEDGQPFRPSSMRLLSGNVRGWAQLSRLDLALDLGQFGLDVGRQGQVVDGVPRAAVRDVERQRAAATRELPLDDVLDRRVGRHVDLLEGAGDDRRVCVLLVGVDADAVYARLGAFLQHAKAAATGDLEQDVSSLVDLALGYALALRRVGEVVRVTDQHLDPGVFHRGRPLVAGDVVVDGRDAHSADSADDVSVLLRQLVLLEHAGDDTDHRARVLLSEEQGQDVRVVEI